MRAAVLLITFAILCTGVGHAQKRSIVEPLFSIWDVVFGRSVTSIPPFDVNDLACGTNGGPISRRLTTPSEFIKCKPEESGLREIHFSYDDELDYVARAMNSEYQVLQDGTSVFAHPVIVSALADEAGILQGIRIVTDSRVGLMDRRRAVSLMRNFTSKYNKWSLECEDLPLGQDEKKIGNHFVKQICKGVSPESDRAIRLDARYLRKPGQTALNKETRALNSTYFEGFTRLEMVRLPYQPVAPQIRSLQ